MNFWSGFVITHIKDVNWKRVHDMSAGSNDKAIVYMIKGAISEMPKENRQKVNSWVKIFKRLIESDEMAGIGFSLVGAEFAAETWRPSANPTKTGLFNLPDTITLTRDSMGNFVDEHGRIFLPMLTRQELDDDAGA